MEMLNPLDTLNDLLNADMSQIDTSFPVLVAGQKEFTISEIHVNDSKKTSGGKTLEMVLKTNFPDKTKLGKDINAGFSMRHYIGLTATDKYDPRQNLAALKEAVFGDKNAQIATNDLIGKTVTALVTIDNDLEFGERNIIKRFIKKV